MWNLENKEVVRRNGLLGGIGELDAHAEELGGWFAIIKWK